jgi:hypothetical protein
LILAAFATGARAQHLDSLLRITEDEVLNQKDKLSPFQRNFFQQLGGTVFLDVGAGNPTGQYRYLYAPTGQRPDSVPIGNDYVTLASVTYEPRYNLVNYSDFFSVSANLPLSALFCIYTRHEGVGGLRAMPTIDLNFFNHATFNNINKFGFTLGGGYALNYAPMFIFEEGKPGFNDKRTWASPVVRTSVKFPYRDQNCFIGATYGFASERIVKGGYRYAKGWLFVINVGIILNYD